MGEPAIIIDNKFPREYLKDTYFEMASLKHHYTITVYNGLESVSNSHHCTVMELGTDKFLNQLISPEKFDMPWMLNSIIFGK